MDNQRANAAQLAARSIKQAKGRQRKTPIKSNGPVQQSMQFGGSGGLFGGAAPAPNSFSFAAPGGLSFPPSSFGNGNISDGNAFSSAEGSENETDPRADTTGEEAARLSRSFQTASGPALFHTPDAFGGTQGSNMFGQPSTQLKPADNPFSFTPNLSQPPASSTFGSTSTATGANNPFTFQPSIPQQPASSGINFNTPSAQGKPVNNPFSFLTSKPTVATPSTSSPAQPAQDKPTHNIFGSLTQPAAPSPVFSFGSPAPNDKPASANTPFTFGQSSTQPPSITFGSVQPAEKPSSTLFGTSMQQPSSSTPAFAPVGQAIAPSNMFSNAQNTTSPVSTLFGNLDQKPVQSASSLFGGLGAQQNVNGTPSAPTQAPAGVSPAEEPKPQPTPSSNIFGNVGIPATASANMFGSPSKQPAPTSNLFAGLSNQTAPTQDLFGNLNKPVQQTPAQPAIDGGFGNGIDLTKGSAPRSTGGSSSSLFGQAPSSNVGAPSVSLFSSPSAPAIASTTPAISFGATTTSSAPIATNGINGNTLFSLTKPIDAPAVDGPTASSEVFRNSALLPQSPSMASSSLAQPMIPSAKPVSANGLDGYSTEQADNIHLYHQMAAATRITEEFMQPLVPARFNDEQRKEFYVAYRMRSLNKAMQVFFTTIAMGSELSHALAYYQEQRLAIMDGSTAWAICSKRKALPDQEQGVEPPTKRNKQPQAPNPQLTRATGAEAPPNPFGSTSQPFSMGAMTPKAPPSASSGPAVQGQATLSSAPTGKRKADVQLTKEDEERGESAGKGMKTPGLNAATTSGSNTSNIFKSIVDSPAKATPEKKVKPLRSTREDAPTFNPFANLPMPSSPAAPKVITPAASVTDKTVPKPASTTSNLFSLKATSGPSSAAATIPSTQSPIKPPNFGTGPVNFLAQFGQQASKSEDKLMQEAKAEDMDSDEDEAEWEAKWKQKRKAELKSIEELGKNKRATFVGGKFTFGQAEKSDSPKLATTKKAADATPALSKGLFSQNSPAGSPGSSVSASATGSSTPTPGIARSNAGSVLDGHAPGKPVSFAPNIFGHLSDADSGAESRKGSNQDSDSAEDESEPEEDSENKDPRYQPGSQQSSSRTSPEETGQGGGPTKKPLFESGASKSAGYSSTTTNLGTSTPGGSLFDRITRDSSGNPVRHISSDEKENTQPKSISNVANTTSPFAKSFDGASETTADQTWKPDSPIRFGTSPTVNVTAATPTKPATPFANLFGNSGSSGQNSSAGGSPKPTLNLFGATAASKPPSNSGGVGFNFGGGLSTTTSSLFPSVAASATTSRATSPGGTTDGDSATEDPDAERHEQINLTAGGPGEEDEEVLHEIRAKALQWSSKDSAQWQTKGVGPLRVLKHKESGATRILLRADPSGTIVLNKSLLPGVKYEVNAKTIKFPAAGEPGKGLETWLLQLKTPEFAQELGKIMENNKPQA